MGQSTNLIANPKYYTESKYSALTLRTSGEVFLEGIVGSWYGESGSRFYGLSAGYRSPEKVFYEGAFGGVRLIDYQGIQLDGDNQFLITVGVGARFDNLFITYRLRHFSNGNTEGNNYGMDVKILGVGVVF